MLMSRRHITLPREHDNWVGLLELSATTGVQSSGYTPVFLSLGTVDIWGLYWALQDIGSISSLYPLDTSCHNPKCLRHGPVFPGEASSTWIRV